jgi:hypothetical protein
VPHLPSFGEPREDGSGGTQRFPGADPQRSGAAGAWSQQWLQQQAQCAAFAVVPVGKADPIPVLVLQVTNQ